MYQDGCNSFTKVQGNRLHKDIDSLDVWGDPVAAYREFKILEYVSKLSPYFPQNPQQHGPYLLSYDYIPATKIQGEFTGDQIHQVVTLLRILHENGFTHGDLSRDNILLDDQGRMHMVDFGASQVVGGRRDIDYESESYLQPKRPFELTDIYYQELGNFLEAIEADDIYLTDY